MSECDPEARYLRRSLLTAGIAAATLLLVLLVWQTRQVVLVFFAAVLFAVLRDGLARLVRFARW